MLLRQGRVRGVHRRPVEGCGAGGRGVWVKEGAARVRVRARASRVRRVRRRAWW